MNKLTEALNALRLEVDGSIVDHLTQVIEDEQKELRIENLRYSIRIHNAEEILWDLIDEKQSLPPIIERAKEYLPTLPEEFPTDPKTE